MSIKKMREAANLTQVEFAKQIGVTQSAVACWENGYNLPRASMLVDIAATLSCTVDDLLKPEAK